MFCAFIPIIPSYKYEYRSNDINGEKKLCLEKLIKFCFIDVIGI
jgi:hypothetical protein